jgi:hypothetical protein
LIGSLAAYASMSLSIFYDEISRQFSSGKQTSNYLVYQVILFGFVSFFCFTILQAMKRNGIDLKSTNFKKKVFFLFNVL